MRTFFAIAMLVALLVTASCGAASNGMHEAVTARTVVHGDGASYHVATVQLGKGADVRMYGGKEGGSTFAVAKSEMMKEDRVPLFMTNGGMYSPKFTPVGLFIERGREEKAINLKDGRGNFHLKPNGVFWLDGKGVARVDSSEEFQKRRDEYSVVYATQSGPMLLIAGKVHQEFRADSSNKLVRSGVGVSSDGRTVHFALSQGGVRFHDFATLFRDELGAHNAIFLDGTVSKMWTVGDQAMPSAKFGSVIAITAPE